MMYRLLKASLALALAVAGAGLLAPTAAQAGPYCSITWGSLDKTAAAPTGGGAPTTVTNVRSGQHACYDRLVLDLSAAAPRASVGYVSQVVGDGGGEVVALRGGAFLHVVLQGVAYPADAGVPGYTPADRNELVDARGYRTLRQVARAGGFEGYDTYGAGVRARLPFRVFVLSGPGTASRVVIDVAHRW